MKTFRYFQVFDFRDRPQSKTWKPWKFYFFLYFLKFCFPLLFIFSFSGKMRQKELPPKKHRNLGNFNPRSLMGYSSKIETILIILILIGKKIFEKKSNFCISSQLLQKKYSMLNHLYVILSFLLSSMLTFISSMFHFMV